MPWQTPTLTQLRALNRDNVTAQLRSGPMIPNSVLRVMADSNAGLGYLTLLYLNWLALQFLPDTAEDEWLARWANLKNVPVGNASYASGSITITGIVGIILPQGATLTTAVGTPTGGVQNVTFQTMQAVTMGDQPTAVAVTALTAGSTGLEVGTVMSFDVGTAGIDGQATLSSFTDGVDAETNTELRANVLDVLRQPPMGGDANDYVQWAKRFPGCTRAWCSPREMGIGTVTLRFMMDRVRATANPMTNGFPTPVDVVAMQTWIDFFRPVTVLDCFVVAPIPEPINFTLSHMQINGKPDIVTPSEIDPAVMANVVQSVTAMLFNKGSPAWALNGITQPAQDIAAVWVADAVYQSVGVDAFDFGMPLAGQQIDHVMPSPGALAVLGNINLG
jgi:uncharacterized phage protein gp47/JayE